MAEVKLQTCWADCDPAGIVYFGNFFRLFEQAEEELYLRSNTDRRALLEKYGLWLPRVEVHVQYVNPIRLGRRIRIRIDPVFKGEKTVRLDVQVHDDETGDQCAHGYMTIVCVDRKTFKSTPIPDELRAAMSAL